MEKNNQELIIGDLFMRLPFGVFVEDTKVSDDPVIYTREYHPNVSTCKPYLRPMSTMTKDEAADMYLKIYPEDIVESVEIDLEAKRIRFGRTHCDVFCHVVILLDQIYSIDQLDWYNMNGFDYRDLIGKGLAYEATGKMYSNSTSKKDMRKFKYLSECNEGDWVYHEAGELAQVCKSEGGFNKFCLRTGYIESSVNNDTYKVYPITLHTKVIAEGIHSYYVKMHEKRLINGSKWVNWLEEKFHKLMELPEDADREDYMKVWREIEEKIQELEYHKSFL